MDVALATSASYASLEPFDRPLLAALVDLGLDARPCIWNDPTLAWADTRIVVVRSTWDSHLLPDAFLAWADTVSRTTRLENPADMLRWNMHKSYLRQLEAKGVPVTPTVWVERGARADLGAAFRALDAEALVIKPAISASARETHVFGRADLASAQHEADRLADEHDLMVQPYLRAFETEGERSYIFLGGAFSHAVRRPPTLTSAKRGFERAQAFAPDDRDEMRLAEATLEAVGGRPLYARVDVATNNDGRPRLQEIELIEPCLFLSLDPAAPGRLARAIASALEARPTAAAQ